MHFAQASSCLSKDCLEFTVWLLGFFTKTIHSLRWNLWYSFESCEFMVRNKRDSAEKSQKLIEKIQILLMETVISNWFICFWKSDVMKKTCFFLCFKFMIKTFIRVNRYAKFQLTRNLIFWKGNAQFKNSSNIFISRTTENTIFRAIPTTTKTFGKISRSSYHRQWLSLSSTSVFQLLSMFVQPQKLYKASIREVRL